ncbi:MAG: hypothetical protein HY717_07255 [Planctomycetes bacterium]|nr:hypothetical protein [Planctomycetota bacterium]
MQTSSPLHPRARKRIRRRRRLIGLWILMVVVLGLGLNFYLAFQPRQIRLRVERALQEMLRGKIQLADTVEVLWGRGIRLYHLQISSPGAAPGEAALPVFQVERLLVKPRIGKLMLGKFEFDEVVLESPVLYLDQDRDQPWSFERILAPGILTALQEGRALSGGADRVRWQDEMARLPRIRILDGALYLRSVEFPSGPPQEASPPQEAGSPAVRRLDLLEISASLQRAAGGELLLSAAARTPFLHQLEVKGGWKPGTGVLNVQLKLAHLELSAQPWRLIPGVGSKIPAFEGRGFLDVEGGLKFTFADPAAASSPPPPGRPGAGLGLGGALQALSYHFSGQLYQGALYGFSAPAAVPAPAGEGPEGAGRSGRRLALLPKLPFPLERLQGDFLIEDGTLHLKSVDGVLGNGPVQLSGTVAAAPGWDRLLGVKFEVKADSVPVDARLRTVLPEELAAYLDSLQLEGTVGLEMKVEGKSFPARLEDLSARVVLSKGSCHPQPFPFGFSGLAGEVTLQGGKLTVTRPLTGRHGQTTLQLTGWKELGGGGGFEAEALLENLMLDESLRNALPAEGAVYWDEFRPSGLISLAVLARKKSSELEAGAGEGKKLTAPEVVVTATGKHVSILYERFPYAVEGITGKFIFDQHRKRITLTDLHGFHLQQEITGKGAFELDDSGKFLVELHCNSLGVDEDILSALSAESRRLLEDFRFQGRVETDVKVYAVSKASGVAVEANLQILEAEIAYALFPYPLRLAGGRIKAIGEDTFIFEGVKTAPGGFPQATFNGGIGTTGGGRIFEFNLTVSDLTVDGRLQRALPEDLRRFVENLGLEGTFQGELQGTFTYDLDQPSRNRVIYRASRVKARDAGVNFGIKMRGMEAEGEFVGGKNIRGNHYFDGMVHVASAWFNRIHLQDADILYTLGREHPAIQKAREQLQTPSGSRPPAGPQAIMGPGEYRPSARLLARLAPDKIADTFQLEVRASRLYGGKVQGFLYIDVGDRHDLAGEFVAGGIQVAQAAPDVFRVQGSDVTGEARGQVSFHGKTGDLRSLSGQGEGIIEKARLMDLPLFVGVVSLLFLQPSSRPHFREVETHYEIHDGKFWAGSAGIAIRGDAVNLNGGGTLDFEGNLDLALTPYFLNLRIPLVDTVVDLVKKTLLQVWVDGKLEEPRARLVTGAGLIRVPIDTKPAEGQRVFPSELKPK